MSAGVTRARVGVTVIAVLALGSPACANEPEPDPAATSTPTTVAEPPPTTRPSCDAALPASWQQAIDASGVGTGGISNVPLAVGRAGEVAAVRDNGDTRDMLLISADKSVTEIYAVPDPKLNNVGFVAMDDRWIVAGLDRAPRGANGVLPTLVRIDVIDKQGGQVRTVVESSEEDYGSGGATIDSTALFGDKVYWITRDTYAGDTGTIKSYDLNTGTVSDVASGAMRNVRATAAGLAWDVAWDENGARAELKIPDALPPPVAGAVGTGRDQMTLVTDGTAYAWITETERGGTGIAWWSPNSGLVRITGGVPVEANQLPQVYVVGPYVILGRGRADQKHDTFATVVDTRSGAITYLRNPVGDADGETIAVGLGGNLKSLPTSTGVVRSGALPPLSC